MHPTWLTKKISIGIILSIVLYLLFRFRSLTYETSFVLPEVEANEVWEFVADFSNMKQLNPTLVDFNILSESGNYEHWKYSVDYTENLSHWPYLYNKAQAHFNIKAEENIYHIISKHQTCLISGYFCLNSNSRFTFKKIPQGTLCKESIEYECPAILTRFCWREVAYQRNAINGNLQIQFNSR